MSELHDTSRVDAYAATRRKAMFLSAVWRPMLAGAAGAALVIAAVWVTLPKISYREVEVPRVTMRDVPVDHVVPKDVEIEVPRIVRKDVEVDIPKIVTHDAALPAKKPDAIERKFIDSPGYKKADISGRIASQNGLGFLFDSGQGMRPVNDDGTPDLTRRLVVDGLIGDWAYCNLKNAAANVYTCVVVHNDVTQQIPLAPATQPGNSPPQTIVPDPVLTPGAVRTTDVAVICLHGTRQLRHWSRERDDRILVEYGLPPGPHPDYEVDHLIPLGIGGADDDKNKWPEPRRSIEAVWNAERKDKLEWKLRDLICARTIEAGAAQQAIAADWTDLYQHIFARNALN
jgi:hypothetical protein